MPNYTENYNLKKPLPNENYNVQDQNDNMDIIDSELKKLDQKVENIEVPVTSVNGKTGDVELTADDVGAETPAGAQAKADAAAAAAVAAHDTKEKHIAYAVASGTNTYTVSIPGITQLVEGMSVKIKFANGNTGASTLNINGLGAKSIVKGNGGALTSGYIKAGQICHLVYTGSAFQLLGEGGEYGTAQPNHVLSGYTIGTEEGIKSGTMPNNGDQSAILTISGSSKPTKTIPAGYTTGGTITAQLNSSLAGNIKEGVNIGGILGTYKGKYVVDDIGYIEKAPSSKFTGVDNDYVYFARSANSDPNLFRYNHAGTLIYTAKANAETNYYGGTYNSDGAIFYRDNNRTVQIFNVSGTLIKTVTLKATPTDHYVPHMGYVNGKILYQTGSRGSSSYTLRLETDTGTVLGTVSIDNYAYMFSNYNNSIIARYYSTSAFGELKFYGYVTRNGNSIITTDMEAGPYEDLNLTLTRLKMFFL